MQFLHDLSQFTSKDLESVNHGKFTSGPLTFYHNCQRILPANDTTLYGTHIIIVPRTGVIYIKRHTVESFD